MVKPLGQIKQELILYGPFPCLPGVTVDRVVPVAIAVKVEPDIYP